MRKTTGILAIQALVVCGLVFGQVIVSSIIGHVTDATGASVPGARITVTNTETEVSVNTITGSEGTYSVPGLLSGTYEVTVEKPGLQTYQTKGITLLSSQTARIDAALVVAGVTQSIAVAAEAARTQTAARAIGSTATTRRLAQLPTRVQTGHGG